MNITENEIMTATQDQLRLWVAEYIDGWKWSENGRILHKNNFNGAHVHLTENKTFFYSTLPNYPENIADAWPLFVSLSNSHKCNCRVGIQCGISGKTNYVARIHGGNLFYRNSSLELFVYSDISESDAICRAILLIKLIQDENLDYVARTNYHRK